MKGFVQKRAGFKKIAALTLTGATLVAPLLSVSLFADAARADKYAIGSGATVNDDGIGSGATVDDGGIGSGATYNGNGGIGSGASMKGGTNITAFGFVTSDVNNNTFQMRRDNGNYVQVKYKGYTPQGLQRGSRISLTGRLTNDSVVHNAIITVIKSGSNNNGNGINISANGVVTSDIFYSTFQLHRDNGSYVQVKFKGYTPAGLKRGSRISLTGRLTNDNVVHDAIITVISNGNSNNNNGAATVDFIATVSSTQSLRLMTVRRDSGLLYNVRSNFNSDTRIGSGDRVHIVGTIYSGSLTVYATRIQLLNDYNNNNGNGNYGYNNGDNVDIRGIVRSSVKQLFIGRVLTVDGDNGNTYEVRTGDDSLTRGTLIRVRGTLSNGFVTNARIDRL